MGIEPAPIVELVECLTPVRKVAVSAVRVSSEIRAEWRDLWPTFPVSCGVLVASCPPEGWRSQLPAGALVHHRGPLSSRSAPTRRKVKMHWKMHWKMQRYPPHT